MAGEPDGTLVDWKDIATSHKWDTLLLGNGMSINIWAPFAYRSLYDHAKLTRLNARERRLFAATPNFERVLADLLTAIEVNEAVGIGCDSLLECYRNVQRALVRAVRDVHLNQTAIPLPTRELIGDVMREFQWVFTTSYDLLVYWGMAARAFEPFMDHFRSRRRCEFDPGRAKVVPGRIPVYFLHGALHLVVGGSGATWKLRQRDLDTILDQFGETIEGDPRARPLLVTEGSTRDKLAAIEGERLSVTCARTTTTTRGGGGRLRQRAQRARCAPGRCPQPPQGPAGRGVDAARTQARPAGKAS